MECHSTGLLHTVKAAMHVRGVAVNREDVMVWSGRKLAVYAFSQDKPTIRDAGTVNDGDQSTNLDCVCALYLTTVGVMYTVLCLVVLCLVVLYVLVIPRQRSCS